VLFAIAELLVSLFLDECNSFLSVAATTPHEFVTTGDFNIHLDNPSDHATSQFLSVLSSYNLIQHINFPTHTINHILDLVITSADSSLAPSLSTSLCSHPIPSQFTLNYLSTLHHCPLQRNIHFAAYTISIDDFLSDVLSFPSHTLKVYAVHTVVN